MTSCQEACSIARCTIQSLQGWQSHHHGKAAGRAWKGARGQEVCVGEWGDLQSTRNYWGGGAQQQSPPRSLPSGPTPAPTSHLCLSFTADSATHRVSSPDDGVSHRCLAAIPQNRLLYSTPFCFRFWAARNHRDSPLNFEGPVFSGKLLPC